MQIPTHPKYDISLDGVVRLISTNEIVPEVTNRHGKRSVKIRGVGFKTTSQPLDRLMLRTYKPLLEDKNEDWLSVKFYDGDCDNITIENLEWDETWYTPPGIIGAEYPLGTWFRVYGEAVEITFTEMWIVRNVRDHRICTTNVNEDGYLMVNLPFGRTMGMHRLIALVFLAHPLDVDHLVINHKDSDPGHNWISNLEWATYRDNINHAYGEGGRTEGVKRIQGFSLSDHSVVTYPSVQEAARVFGVNASSIHNLLSFRQSKGLGYKGFILKYEDDPTPWTELLQDTKRNLDPHRIAVKDLRSGEITIHDSLSKTMAAENIRAMTVYRLLAAEVPIPWQGKCMQAYKERDMTWPDYPQEIVDVYSTAKNIMKPFKVTHVSGSVEYAASLTVWCSADRDNRCDPAVLSRAIAKHGKWRDWVFEYVNLKDYI